MSFEKRRVTVGADRRATRLREEDYAYPEGEPAGQGGVAQREELDVGVDR